MRKFVKKLVGRIGGRCATARSRFEAVWSWFTQDWKHVGYLWTIGALLMAVSIVFDLGFG